MGMHSIKTYLEPDLAKAVQRIARDQGRSESAFIADAVRSRVGLSAPQISEAERSSLLRGLNRVERRIDKVIWEQAQLKEIMLQFIRVWLEYTPPLAADIEESAAIVAEARFQRFMDLVVNSLTSNQSAGELLDTHARNPIDDETISFDAEPG